MQRAALLALLLPALQDWDRGARIVAAFYSAKWDADAGDGMTRPEGGDALEVHPPSMKGFSFRSPDWHRANLEEMAAAGIDAALCDFAGRAEAVGPLVKALEAIEAAKGKAPRVAPATDDPARALSFLETVPRRFHAAVAGASMIWLLPSPKASGEALADLRGRAAAKLGGDLPFVVADRAWGEPDAILRTGGAMDGPSEADAVTLGPGYKDGPDRVRDREEGAWYDRSWWRAWRLRPRFVAIESWNGYDRACAVCETRETKRAHLEATREHARRFHRNEEPPRPRGRYTGVPLVAWNLKYDPPDAGLRPMEVPGGRFDVAELAGLKALTSKADPSSDRRMIAFDVDDSWGWFERRTFLLEVEALDTGEGKITVEYDAATAPEGGDRTRRALEPSTFTGTGEWKTFKFRLPDAALANRQEGGSDLRLVTVKRGISIRWAALRPSK